MLSCKQNLVGFLHQMAVSLRNFLLGQQKIRCMQSASVQAYRNGAAASIQHLQLQIFINVKFTVIIILTSMQPLSGSICKYGFFCKSLISLGILAVTVILVFVIDLAVICPATSEYDASSLSCIILFILGFFLIGVFGINMIIVIVASCCFWIHRSEESIEQPFLIAPTPTQLLNQDSNQHSQNYHIQLNYSNHSSPSQFNSGHSQNNNRQQNRGVRRQPYP